MFLEKHVPLSARSAYRKDALAAILVGAYSGAIGPFASIIARDTLKASVLQIGLMSAAPAIGSMFALFWANAMEGRNKMPFVVWSLVIGRAVFIGMLFCYTPLQFSICVIASNILVTISGPAYAAIIKEIYPDAHRGRIMSYCRVLLAVTMIVSTLVMGKLLKQPGNFRYIFSAAGLFGVASALVFGKIRLAPNKEVGEQKRPPFLQFLRNSLQILRDDHQFRWFAMSVFTFGFGNLLLGPLYPIYSVDRLHITTSQQSILMGAFYVVWILSYIYWGRFVDMRSPLLCAAISVFVTGLVPITYFFATSPWSLIPASMVNGFIGAGIELAYFNAVLQFADEARVSHYQALFAVLFGIRGTLGPLIGTAMINGFHGVHWDVKYLFLVGLLFIWAGGIMQVVGIRTRYKPAH